MSHNIEVTIFPQPSDNVRGTIVAMLEGKRVAHAYLFTDKPPQIALDKVRGNPSVADIREYVAVLSGFADEVTRNRAHTTKKD